MRFSYTPRLHGIIAEQLSTRVGNCLAGRAFYLSSCLLDILVSYRVEFSRNSAMYLAFKPQLSPHAPVDTRSREHVLSTERSKTVNGALPRAVARGYIYPNQGLGCFAVRAFWRHLSTVFIFTRIEPAMPYQSPSQTVKNSARAKQNHSPSDACQLRWAPLSCSTRAVHAEGVTPEAPASMELSFLVRPPRRR